MRHVRVFLSSTAASGEAAGTAEVDRAAGLRACRPADSGIAGYRRPKRSIRPGVTGGIADRPRRAIQHLRAGGTDGGYRLSGGHATGAV